ncbi:MAG TPA: hypothetical protein VFI47_13225 [Acidimicrobiales bacterium]|nr:hypothetical protein [Acidimicrobiales bacterium]
MRIVWIVLAVLVVIGLGAWSTTFHGPRPIPTGERIPPATAPAEPTTAATLAPQGG